MPPSAAAEHLGPRPPLRIAVAPLSRSPWRRGSFFQSSTLPPACQTRPSAVPGAWTGGRRGGGGGGPEVGPSLSKTRSRGKQATAQVDDPSWGPREGNQRRSPLRQCPRRPRASGDQRLLKAAPRTALNPSPGVRAGSPLHQPCPAPPFLLRSTPTCVSGGPERPTRPTCSDPERRCLYLCPRGLRGDGPRASISVIPCKTGDPDPSTSFLMGPSPCTPLEVTWPPILHS